MLRGRAQGLIWKGKVSHYGRESGVREGSGLGVRGSQWGERDPGGPVWKAGCLGRKRPDISGWRGVRAGGEGPGCADLAAASRQSEPGEVESGWDGLGRGREGRRRPGVGSRSRRAGALSRPAPLLGSRHSAPREGAGKEVPSAEPRCGL